MFAIRTSRRARSITDSITLAISARANQMRAEGIDVVSLGAGEPDFGTAAPIAESGIAAIRKGDTRYTAAAGMPDVRRAAAGWFGRRFGLDYAADEVMVTAGAKPALSQLLTTLVDEGDRVLLPAPFWASYTELVRLAGGEPVILDPVPEQGFIHTGSQIAAAAEAHGCRGVMLNFPNNPSGAVPSRAQVESMVNGAIDAGMWIVSDEIYARLIYDGLEHVSPAVFPQARERTFVVNGGTKSHSMTGWRVGFLAGPRDAIAAVSKVQSQGIGNPCTISQRAVLTMCEETDDTELHRRLAAFDQRRRFLVEAVAAIDGLSVGMPHGAFYVFFDAREACARAGIDDVEFSERLLTEGLVAAVPGTPFAAPGFVRLSYAASMADLERGAERLRAFVAKLG